MARLLSARTLLIGGLAAGAAIALRNKKSVMGLLGGGQDTPEPYRAPEPAAAPPIANVDVAGPPANTATHVPAPEPVVHDPSGGIDEAAEEAAAAAEAANIGGTPEEYPSEEDPLQPADEAHRPLEEAGEGYSEGQELAEADLIDNAEPSAGDPIEGERAIEEAIEAQDDPTAGEAAEATEQMPLPDAPPPTGAPAADMPPPVEEPPAAAALTPSGTAAPEEADAPAAPDPATTEISAETKRSEVWRVDEQPTAERDALDDEADKAS